MGGSSEFIRVERKNVKFLKDFGETADRSIPAARPGPFDTMAITGTEEFIFFCIPNVT
jgi:hypothetical protein